MDILVGSVGGVGLSLSGLVLLSRWFRLNDELGGGLLRVGGLDSLQDVHNGY